MMLPHVLTHTFTAIGYCPRDHLLGVAITTSPPAVGSRCPFIARNVGAISSQAYTDPGLGLTGLRLLKLGFTPRAALEHLAANDDWHEYRQIGIVDAFGNAAAVTGVNNLEWHGHATAPGFVAMGNYLAGPQVLDAMMRAFHGTPSEILEERLVCSLEAGRDAGGEKGGQLSASLLVYGRPPYPRTDLRVDAHRASPARPGDAVHELRRLFDRYKPLIDYYELRPRNPLMPSWREWSAKAAGGQS